MNAITSNNMITWNLYAKSGDVEIWEGTPRFGNWSQWEVRNVKTGETRNVSERQAPLTFQEMLISINESNE